MQRRRKWNSTQTWLVLLSSLHRKIKGKPLLSVLQLIIWKISSWNFPDTESYQLSLAWVWREHPPMMLAFFYPVIIDLSSLLALLAIFMNEFIFTLNLSCSIPVTEILSREVLRVTSILWIKDIISKGSIWNWSVVEAVQRERAICCTGYVT